MLSQLLVAYKESKTVSLAQYLASNIENVASIDEFYSLPNELIFQILDQDECVITTPVAVRIIKRMRASREVDVGEILKHINANVEEIDKVFKEFVEEQQILTLGKFDGIIIDQNQKISKLEEEIQLIKSVMGDIQSRNQEFEEETTKKIELLKEDKRESNCRCLNDNDALKCIIENINKRLQEHEDEMSIYRKRQVKQIKHINERFNKFEDLSNEKITDLKKDIRYFQDYLMNKVQHLIPPEKPDSFTENPFECCSNGDIDSIRYILYADPNVLTLTHHDTGNTLLHEAIIKDQTEIALMLIKNGIEVNSVNRNHETPLDISSRMNNVKITGMLKSKGGQKTLTSELKEVSNSGKSMLLGSRTLLRELPKNRV